MKTMTLTQPWATLVAIGAKRIETRSWHTAYRGPLAIHAAKGFPAEARQICQYHDPFYSVLKKAGYTKPEDLPLGVIVATCELVSCIPILPWSASTFTRAGKVVLPPAEPELSFGDYTSGRYAWILTNIKRLETPIPARGALGLWDFPGL